MPVVMLRRDETGYQGNLLFFPREFTHQTFNGLTGIFHMQFSLEAGLIK